MRVPSNHVCRQQQGRALSIYWVSADGFTTSGQFTDYLALIVASFGFLEGAWAPIPYPTSPQIHVFQVALQLD